MGTVSTGDRLMLTQAQVVQIERQVTAGAPLEVCGLLAGRSGRVWEVIPIPNVSSTPGSAYRMDARAQVEAMLAIEARGWDLVGIYHSHPPGERSDPSPTDVAQAYYRDVWYVIAVPNLRDDEIGLRAFRIDARGEVSESKIHVLAG